MSKKTQKRVSDSPPFNMNSTKRDAPAKKPRSKLEDVTTISDLTSFLKIGQADWDYLIVGDGSGTTWEKEFGWGSVLIERGSFERTPFFGAMSNGTNNMGEIMAVLHPLMYLANQGKGVRAHGAKVHVVSDSEYVVGGLRNANPVWASKLKVNRELWMAIHMTRRRGLIIEPHHVPRDTIDLNKLGHDLANLARRSQIKLLDKLDWDIDQANPD
jgi:ribonuclease HI